MRPTLFRHKSKSSTQWLARQSRDPYVKRKLLPSSFPSQTGSLANPTNPDDASSTTGSKTSSLIGNIQFRARSAFKLLEVNAHPTMGGFLDHEDVNAVVDLGAAPGGWSQVVAAKFGWEETGHGIGRGKGVQLLPQDTIEPVQEGAGQLPAEGGEDLAPSTRKRKKVKKPPQVEELTHWDPLNIDDLLPNTAAGNMQSSSTPPQGRGTIVAVDLLPVLPIPGVHTLRADFLDPSTSMAIQALLSHQTGQRSPKSDVILSDIAVNSTGHTISDIENSLSICEAALQFAKWNLRSAESVGRRRGGVLLMKFFAHPLLDAFRREQLEPNFNYVHYVKPESSRAGSKEGYFLCQGWLL